MLNNDYEFWLTSLQKNGNSCSCGVAYLYIVIDRNADREGNDSQIADGQHSA